MTTKTTTYSLQSKAGFLRWGVCSACVVAHRLLFFLLLSLLLTPLTALFTACGYDNLVMPDIHEEEESESYIELCIAVPFANPSYTRANPMGGEEGNGRETGILNEDIIHDINVFFYIEENGLGMNSSDTTKIIRHIYYNIKVPDDVNNTEQIVVEDLDDKSSQEYIGYMSLRFPCSQEDINRVKKYGGINFVAVANFGPLQKISSLGELRNIDFENYDTNAWNAWRDAFSSDAAKMDYFLMSTAYNDVENGRYGTNKISEVANGKETIYTGTTTLQRIYARLDLWYNNSTEEDKTNVIADGEKIKELKYKVKDAASNTVYLTNVLPVNVMQYPSYLFKKVTNINATWNADKTIWNKEKLNAVSSYSWGGKESPQDGPFSSTYNDLPTNYVIERHTNDKIVGGETPGIYLDKWYGKTAVQYVSGASEYNNRDCSIKNTKLGRLSDYYHGVPPSGNDPNYDCNHISIISYANENTHPTDCFHSNYLTGMAFRAVYVPEKIYKGYDATNDETIIWEDTDPSPTQIYRYSPSVEGVKEIESYYFTNIAAAEAYAKNHSQDNALINEFTAEKHDGKLGFICYYNLWLRHYNDESADPQLAYPMEYATVRNNIYRVSLTFRGPGDPTPTMRAPDTMQARIFVRKWNLRKEGKPLDF